MTGGGGIDRVQAPNISNPQNFQPTGFNTFGTQGSFDKATNSYNLNDMNILLGPLQRYRRNQFAEASAFGGLLDTVRPGFSQFRQAGLNQIENARQKNISNLSDNLAQRRVLGSSFANASISNANADFAQKSADFIAQSYLEELSASTTLTQQKFDATAKGYQATIQQLNLDAAMGAQLSSTATTTLASVAETQAQLQLQAAEFNAQEQMFEQQMKMAEMSALGSGIGSIFGMFGGGGMSDRRVKENIEQIGTTVHDLPLYKFNYRNDDTVFEGVMADDVMEVIPEAVSVGPFGALRVDYDMLGIEMRYHG